MVLPLVVDRLNTPHTRRSQQDLHHKNSDSTVCCAAAKREPAVLTAAHSTACCSCCWGGHPQPSLTLLGPGTCCWCACAQARGATTDAADPHCCHVPCCRWQSSAADTSSGCCCCCVFSAWLYLLLTGMANPGGTPRLPPANAGPARPAHHTSGGLQQCWVCSGHGTIPLHPLPSSAGM